MTQSELQKKQNDIIENHGELVLDLSGRVGNLVAEGDFASVAILAKFVDSVFQMADAHYVRQQTELTAFSRAPIRVQ
jgi:hypothetical protein